MNVDKGEVCKFSNFTKSARIWRIARQMTKIYLVRHAEAEGNLYRRAQGQYDSLVTDKGFMQIEALRERFKDIHIDAVYSSDLFRTKMTATSIYKSHQLPLNTDPRLREINVGVWEDCAWGDIWHDDKEQLRYFTSEPEKWNIEGGEDFEALKTRMVDVISEIAAKHDGETIALFSHGMAIRTFLCHVTGTPICNISSIAHSENTGVSMFTAENNVFKLEYMNDSSHLSDNIKGMNTQGWWKNKDGFDRLELRYEPMNMRTQREKFIECYKDTWYEIYKDFDGFGSGEQYWRLAKADAKIDEMAVAEAFVEDDFAGIIEVNLDNEVYGNIAFCYMREKFRGFGMGVQLIGYAVSLARKHGKIALRLNVSSKNERARNFYKKYGFREIGKKAGSHGDIIVMEKSISKFDL